MDKEMEIFWEKVQQSLQNEPSISTVSYEVFLKTLEPMDYIEDKLVIIAPTSLSLNSIMKGNYYDLLEKTVKTFNHNIEGINLICAADVSEFLRKHYNFKKQELPEVEEVEKPMFDKKYSFENFVVGKSNQFVYAAAENVSQSPGNNYNPLFIYGSSGLGKTHLMHAIGNYLEKSKPELKICYVPGERFVNELVDAIKGGQIRGKNSSTRSFREKYRNLDVLMIDDIQVIENKTQTQEEFFHTFNDLYQNKKQIIISSDRHPKYLTELSDRLRSRFQWGLTCDIQPPEIETRLAILRKKAEQEKYEIDNDVLSFIAEKFQTNIREMEGALSRITFYSGLLGKSCVDIETAKEALKDFVEEKQDRLSSDIIIEKTCEYFNVSKEEIISKKKTKEIALARMICIYLITDVLSMPLSAIGSLMGGRDHTTIIHSRDKIADAIKTEGNVSHAVKDIKAMVFKK